MRRLVFAGFLALVVSFAVNAATDTAEGTVSRVYTYGDGRVLVTGFTFTSTSCNNGGFYIRATHPNIDRLLALVLSAQARGATLLVSAEVDNCWYPEITESSTTYVRVE